MNPGYWRGEYRQKQVSREVGESHLIEGRSLWCDSETENGLSILFKNSLCWLLMLRGMGVAEGEAGDHSWGMPGKALYAQVSRFKVWVRLLIKGAGTGKL